METRRRRRRRAVPPRSSTGSTSIAASASTARAPWARGRIPSLENVPGHVIPTLADEFDDFELRSKQLPRRRAGRGHLHPLPAQTRCLRTAPGRRADDPGFKLPFGGVSPEQMEELADVIEALGATAQGPRRTHQNIAGCHHVRLAGCRPKLIREASAKPASPHARAVATRCATSPPTPTPQHRHRRGLQPHPLCRRPTSVTSSAIPSPRRCRASGRPPAPPPRPTARSCRSTIGFLPVRRDAALVKTSAASRSGSAAAPRRCRAWPKIFEFVGADNGEYLRVRSDGRPRSSTARGTAGPAQEPQQGARIKVLVDRIGPEAFRAQVDEELAEASGPRTRLHRRAGSAALRIDEEEVPGRPSIPADLRLAPTAERPSSTAGAGATSSRRRQAGFFSRHD